MASDEFRSLANRAATDLGLAELRIVSIPHPIGGIEPNQVRCRADNLVNEILILLTNAECRNNPPIHVNHEPGTEL